MIRSRLVDIAHNPLSVDLEGDDLGARMKATAAELSPRVAAAGAVLTGVVRADDGLTVEVARSCPAGARCVDLAAGVAADDDPLEARARFLAWGLGYAVRLRSTDAGAVARELRILVQKDGDAVALVVDEASLAGSVSKAALDVHQEAGALGKALGRRAPAAQVALARSFAGGASPAMVAPWLVLDESEILVVPRLAYVGRRAELLAEIRGLLGRLDRPERVALAPD